MQLQHHVNFLRNGYWPRCREVSVVDGQLRCLLALDRTYDLIRAYQSDLHLRFMGCASEKQLASFARTWGPLSFSIDEFDRGSCSAPLSSYWNLQGWLKGFVNLLGAFKDSTGEREALHNFISADIDAQGKGEPFSILGLKNQLGIKCDVFDWLRNSALLDLRSAVDFMIQVTPIGATAHLQCVRSSGKTAVEGRWGVSTLREALRWMVWYDEFTQHPLVCCQACRKIFRPETAHPRKYCSYECAHRIAAREWQRKQRRLRGN